jgi:GTP-binding protein
VEIAKYLGRRQMLRGAVLLVDAVSGLKESDRMVLALLRDANVRTMVVLTKVDKLREETSASRATRRVEDVCAGVWEELRGVEKGSLTWLEGQEKGWQPEIFVTSAGDPGNDGQGVGVVGARWAICRMAGLLEDNRVLLPATQAPPPVPKIISFDQIQWAPTSTEPKADIKFDSA